VVPAVRPPFTTAQRTEIAQLTKQAEELYDLYAKARGAGSPEADALLGDAARAAQALIRQVVQLMGLPPSYADRIRFDANFFGSGHTDIKGNVGIIGWNVITGDGAAVVSTIAHEAAHLYQRDRDNLTLEKFDAKRDFYESEATRIAEDYLRKLGYPEATIRALRGYSVEVK
jgi:hypothetical protein